MFLDKIFIINVLREYVSGIFLPGRKI